MFIQRVICVSLLVSLASTAMVSAQQVDTILTNNVVELRETISPQGFVHPGISCNAETLSVMREKVIAGVSPWAEHFEGMRRTRFADLKRKPARVQQILNDGGISGFAHDAHLAWTQTILYVVTGNEEYRKLPVEIIKWYGSRTEQSFFPTYFSDSHIKIGKYVYTLCCAVDILRTTMPKDESLAVTQEMVDALQKNCLHPIRKTCIERNDYFMNQHSYAIMGYLASTILGDEVEDYKQAVEWTTVNATSPNQGRNGSIKQQIRLVTRNDATGQAVEPNLQLVEMGRDMPHAAGNITNLVMMSKTIDFQKTRVDPVNGTVTAKADGVSPFRFLDERLIKGAVLYAKYNLGYGLPWVPTYSETDSNHPDYLARYDHISPRGRGSGVGAGPICYFKGIGVDIYDGPYRYLSVDFDPAKANWEGARTGVYLDNVHNYGFDFWIGLPAASSDAAPNPEKAKRALAATLPPLEVKPGAATTVHQVEDQFLDLSAYARPGDIYPGTAGDIPLKVMHDADGTRFVRMTLAKDPRTVLVRSRFPQGSAFRVRCNSFVKLSFHYSEDFARRGPGQELYVPDTNGEWTYVTADVAGNGLLYVQATPLAGSAIIDFDRIESAAESAPPVRFDNTGGSENIQTYVGASVALNYSATHHRHLPGGGDWVPGRRGDALRLSGDRQFACLKAGVVNDLEFLSITAWVKPEKVDRWARIFDFGNDRESYMFLTPSDGRTLKFAIRTPGSPNEQAVSGKGPLRAGEWQHVAITLSGNTAVLYVNGEEVGRNTKLTLKPSGLGKTQRNFIGKSQSDNPYLAGMVEDFIIYNTALNAEDVKRVYGGDGHIDAGTEGVHYKFDRSTVEGERQNDPVQYAATQLPAGATFDEKTGALRWTPSAEQTGEHSFYVTARAGSVVRTAAVKVHVAADLQAALDQAAKGYDPAKRYIATTERPVKAALEARDLPELQRAVAGLQLVSPRLPDGTLDYLVASGPPIRVTNINMMADNDPFTWGGIWGFDKNITIDFGNDFKVRSEAFRMLPRDGHPARMVEAVVYGSNDRRRWTLLTENKTVRSCDFQTLTVKAEERAKLYRYLRLFMPAKPLPIFEVAEFRIVGERVEDHSPDYHVAYITGFDDGTFRPDQKLTKAEAVCLLAGLVDDYTDKGAYKCNFVDAPPNAPYYDDLAYMANKGIGHTWSQPVKYVTADAENRFHPDAAISRGELAGIMARMKWLAGAEGPKLNDVTTETPNAAEIRRVAREGWLTADEGGAFHPNVPVTRAEFVVAINRMLQRTEQPREGMPSFSDVNASHHAYSDIMRAATTYPADPNRPKSGEETAKSRQLANP